MARKLILYFFLFFFSWSITTCSFIPNELKTAEQLIETAPDSALHILQHMSPKRYKSDESRALYGLLMIRTLNKKLLPLKPDSLLDFSIAYYEEHPQGDQLAKCYLFKGRTFKYYSDYEEAMSYYLKAIDETKNSRDYLLKGKIHSDMGDINSIQGDFMKARQKYIIAYNYFIKTKSVTYAYNSLIDIGITFYQTNEYNQAQKYFRKVYLIAKDSITKGLALDEIGRCYYKSKQNDSSLKYLRKVIPYPYLGYNRAKRYNFLARIYFDLKQTDSAYFYALNTFNYKPDIRIQRDCYRILTNTEFLRGNMRKMSMYMNKYVILGDSIRKIDAQIKGSYMETTHNANIEAHENKVQKWISWGVILILIVGSLFLFRYILRKVKRTEVKTQETHIEQKIGIHKKAIEDKRAILQKHIEDRKETMQAKFKSIGSQEREQQLLIIYKELLQFDETGIFFNEMDKLLNGLITKLKSRYSTITDKELKLCCYILLHIPTYDMLILFEYKSHNSLKSLKKRLPPKFNIKNVTLLEAFLLGILAED